MSLLVKARHAGQRIVEVTPASAGWTYVGFEALRLAAGEHVARASPDRETCLVVLSGSVDVSTDGPHGPQRWSAIGTRRSVFDDLGPTAVYLPPAHRYDIQAHDSAEIALCSAPAEGQLPPRLIEPAAMPCSVRGSGSNTRYVRDILPQSAPAEHLLVVEVRTPSGHSSSYPPHRHDHDDRPRQSALEETYYHRIQPSQGFALQRVYTDDRSLDEAYAVEDHDVVQVPRGYHPVVMPHGYEGYYLNVMAGAARAWHFHNDPQHEWLLQPR